MNRGCPGSTTWPGRARTSVTRPVTGAFTRTSSSSLNCTLPVVSSTAARVRTSGCTTRTGSVAAPGAGTGWASCSDLESLHPERRATRRRGSQGRTLRLKVAAHGRLERVHRGAVVGDGAEVLEGLLPVAPLGVQIVEEGHSAPPVRELDGLARLLHLGKVVVAKERGLLALGGDGGQRRVDLGERLGEQSVPRRLHALGLGLGPGDLALVPVEDLDGQGEAEANGVVGTDALILDLRCHVPPRIGLGQTDVSGGFVARGLRGAEIGAGVEGHAVELRLALGELGKSEVAHGVEIFGDASLAHHGAKGDAGAAEG